MDAVMTTGKNKTFTGGEYVEHYWHSYMAGMQDWEGDNNIVGFFVSDDDRQKFPSLRTIHIVEIKVTDDRVSEIVY